MKKLIIENEVVIEAPIAKVWQVLTDPKLTPEYMYGCAVESSWKIGDPVLWRAVQNNVVYVKGHLVEWVEGSVFAFTTFDPTSSIEDIPENYLTARYELNDQDGQTTLKVTHGDYNAVAEGESRYADTQAQGGWGAVLESIKKIAERMG
ncbi:MAG: SRPBCC domain-containing protein [Bacteroidota bacterium]